MPVPQPDHLDQGLWYQSPIPSEELQIAAAARYPSWILQVTEDLALGHLLHHVWQKF